jgi:hypothetical protein
LKDAVCFLGGQHVIPSACPGRHPHDVDGLHVGDGGYAARRPARHSGSAFDTSPIVQVFSLNQVAPPGALGQEVRVYIAPDPRYSERADFNRND